MNQLLRNKQRKRQSLNKLLLRRQRLRLKLWLKMLLSKISSNLSKSTTSTIKRENSSLTNMMESMPMALRTTLSTTTVSSQMIIMTMLELSTRVAKMPLRNSKSKLKPRLMVKLPRKSQSLQRKKRKLLLQRKRLKPRKRKLQLWPSLKPQRQRPRLHPRLFPLRPLLKLRSTPISTTKEAREKNTTKSKRATLMLTRRWKTDHIKTFI
jgi:hypothetical protein